MQQELQLSAVLELQTSLLKKVRFPMWDPQARWMISWKILLKWMIHIDKWGIPI